MPHAKRSRGPPDDADVPEMSPLARAPFTADGDRIGEMVGADEIFLTPVELPPAVPEPSTWALMMLGFVAMGGFLSRSRQTPVSAVAMKSGG